MLVEYAVNAYGPPEVNFKALDGLVQQLLRNPDPPDMAFVYVGDRSWKPKDGWESEKVQPVGRHYGFLEVMARAHLQTKLDAGEVKWNVVFRDGIHPRMAGYNDPKQSAHAIYAQAVIALLKEQMAIRDEPTPVPPVPEPFYSDDWTTAQVIPVSAAKRKGSWQAKPAQGTGMSYFEEFLESNETGASLTLTTETTAFVIFAYPGFDGGTIAWSIDGEKERSYWMGKGSEQNLLSRVWSVDAATDLLPGEHTLKVWVAPQKEGTRDNWVRVGGFGVAPPHQ